MFKNLISSGGVKVRVRSEISIFGTRSKDAEIMRRKTKNRKTFNAGLRETRTENVGTVSVDKGLEVPSKDCLLGRGLIS